MSIWTNDNPPTYFPTAKATNSGWVNPDTGEVLVHIGNLATKAGGANVVAVEFGEDAYLRGESLSAVVSFNEGVDVTAGSTLVVTSSISGAITLYALAHDNQRQVTYNKAANLTDPVAVPDVAAELTIGAQSVGGTIVDELSPTPATGVLTATANFTADEVVTIGTKDYTFKATVTAANNVDGYVKLGSDYDESISALVEAINLVSSGSGVLYAALTTIHPTVTAKQTLGGVMTATAKTAGTGGNTIATTTTAADASWGAATLESGAIQTTGKAISSTIAAAAGTITVKKAAVDEVNFDEASYARGDELSVTVTFDGTVDVPVAGASIVVTSTQNAGNITLYAAEQSGSADVVFAYEADLETAVTVPDEAGTLSVGAQTIGGTVYDADTTLAATKTVSAGQGTAAGTRVIPAPAVTAIAFGAASYAPGAAFSVEVTYDEPVDVTAGAYVVVTSTAGDFNAYAAVQSDVTTVVFNKLVGGGALTAPVVDTTLSIGAQTIQDGTGSIVDGSTGSVVAGKVVTAGMGTTAGTRVIDTADVSSVAFGAGSYAPTDPLSVTVTFDEAVDVTGGATLVVTSTQVSGNVTLYAAAQTNVTAVVFNKLVNLTDPVPVVNEDGTLSVGAQTIGGTIVDHDDATAAVKTISAGQGTAAGTRVITHV